MIVITKQAKAIQRKHKRSKGKYPVDIYKEIDNFIPEATEMADLKYPGAHDGKVNMKLKNDWSVSFLEAMDKILKKRRIEILMKTASTILLTMFALTGLVLAGCETEPFINQAVLSVFGVCVLFASLWLLTVLYGR